MAFTAVALACIVGIPVGLLINRNEKLANAVIGVANVMQTVPSLAMFALLIPLVGIRDKNAILAFMPAANNQEHVYRHQKCDPSIIEAAMGMVCRICRYSIRSRCR